MGETFLKIENITKTFPGVKALDNVDLEVEKGEIHVLIGENGAGKSTLIKILTGLHQPDSGKIVIEGNEIKENNLRTALDNGIIPIYQELNLIQQLDVTENIFMGREIKRNEKFGIIDRKFMEKRTQEILDRLNQNISPTAKIQDLGVGKQQMVEIAKALSVDVNLLILDEPTSSLGEDEVNELFKTMEKLKEQGVTMIFISHKLSEAKRIGDRITILRDGQHVSTNNIEDVSEEDIVRDMVGRDIDEQFPKIQIDRGEEILRVENLKRDDTVNDISFSAYRGEVLGIAGLVGAGRTELVRTVIGADKKDSGNIYINGRKVEINHPKDALKEGMVLLTEDRKTQGLFLDQTVKFNIVSSNLNKYKKNILLDLKHQAQDSEKYVNNLKIKTPGIYTKAKQLSGGNQQKVVIGKWLNTNAEIFIFDEPTRGIDVGAKVEIYNIINELIGQGKSVIMVSSELPEILGVSDRILVVSEGKLTAELNAKDATQEKIMSAATVS
ncbi:monosaccharide ABC transporter ATP-binding protein (CUT2 family) [Halanaerobium saccharolyticum]|uniref:Monosaccharide ABC transporter ATP-binding protein (CUT2 family) n=1 Tax=Halanaerobium saccharolyticum TaxID=43595 RepID=A0A4R7YN81_9FIRM|nr:sugar ABC transporter ATP-binding protein [Halanaerobium saccharolyticum]RAK05199.1 monosaccharide ABC transporter ATP-binding protein (CUT2 family) [Halanaerobium saccharolyticum]TDV99030.1 monosaccharide ABC transporter ATP-binding protein (CUT2 family) [Halanaerobium saccharolyticum]TDX51721.1 monosaccharide ABC transporter ATP-binding protein (CUT2 family) [Halanaerobium saccharolyticum]